MTRLGGWGVPGSGVQDITVERNVIWGGDAAKGNVLYASALIAGGSTDAANTPTTVLRAGLVLGKVTATGKYVPYSKSATDGSQIARAVLPYEIMTVDFAGVNADRVVPIIVGGPVMAGQLIGLDALARSQMSRAFLFDDDNVSAKFVPPNVVTKTNSYTVLAGDTGTVFLANGSGALTFTLPAIGPGLYFRFVNIVDQNMIVASAEGSNIVAAGTIAGSSLTFSTSSQKKGAVVEIFSNPAGSLWIAQVPCSNTLTIA